MVTDGESPGQEQIMFRVLFLNQLLEPRFHCDVNPLLGENVSYVQLVKL